MRSSAIFNRVYTDNKSDRSFGTSEYLEQEIFVGSSAKNSHEIARIKVNKFFDQGTIRFEFLVDHQLIKTMIFERTRRDTAGKLIETVYP